MIRFNKGEYIKNLRLARKLTLDDVGAQIGVSKQTLYKYENNIITNIPSNKIELLANLYNISPSNIMGWEEAPKGYYNDPEVVALAEEAHTNKDLKILFSASKSLSKENMQKALDFINFLKSQEKNERDLSE